MTVWRLTLSSLPSIYLSPLCKFRNFFYVCVMIHHVYTYVQDCMQCLCMCLGVSAYASYACTCVLCICLRVRYSQLGNRVKLESKKVIGLNVYHIMIPSSNWLIDKAFNHFKNCKFPLGDLRQHLLSSSVMPFAVISSSEQSSSPSNGIAIDHSNLVCFVAFSSEFTRIFVRSFFNVIYLFIHLSIFSIFFWLSLLISICAYSSVSGISFKIYFSPFKFIKWF